MDVEGDIFDKVRVTVEVWNGSEGLLGLCRGELEESKDEKGKESE